MAHMSHPGPGQNGIGLCAEWTELKHQARQQAIAVNSSVVSLPWHPEHTGHEPHPWLSGWPLYNRQNPGLGGKQLKFCTYLCTNLLCDPEPSLPLSGTQFYHQHRWTGDQMSSASPIHVLGY